jgi:RNA polymerase sigma-70 factor (ECF subfamily)
MQSSADEISDLLERLARGDERAFDPLYDATSLKLFGIVFRILRQQQAAEELLQEVYVKVWKNAERFDRRRASPITWLATIARNSAIDVVRRRQPLDAVEPEDWHEIRDSARSPLENVALSEDLQRLENCLGALEPDRSEAIRLAYLDGVSRQALANRFGQPVGTIKTWLHRGLKQLRDWLES